MHSLSLLLVAIFAVFVSAATESSSNYDDYMAQSPSCSRACQKAALETDGCSNIDDFECHCTNIAILESILEPCLAQTLHCAEEEITAAAKSICDFSKGSPSTNPDFPLFPSIPSIKPDVPSMPPLKPHVPWIPTPKPEIPLIPSSTPDLPALPSSKPELPLIPSSKPAIPLISSSKPVISSTPPSTPIIPSKTVTPLVPSSSKAAVPSSSRTTLELPTPSPHKSDVPLISPTKPHHSSEVQTGTASSQTPCPSVINGKPCPIHGIAHNTSTETPTPAVTKTVVIPSSKPSTPPANEAPADDEPAPKPTQADDDSACQPPRTTIVVTATMPPNASGTPGIKGYEAVEEEESAAAHTVALFSVALPVAAFVGLLQVL